MRFMKILYEGEWYYYYHKQYVNLKLYIFLFEISKYQTANEVRQIFVEYSNLCHENQNH